ncbi:MAG: hypothetical protein ACM3SO_23695 [Betaproteobacteria bacterium]
MNRKATLAVLAFVPTLAWAAGQAPWACGGVSAEERRALPSQVPDANLELLFVSGQRGAYAAGAEWRVLDRANEPVAHGTSDGPQCFLRVPPGPVRVEAKIGGETRTAKATAGAKRTRLVFTFPAEPGEDIQASPEEKAQAKE